MASLAEMDGSGDEVSLPEPIEIVEEVSLGKYVSR